MCGIAGWVGTVDADEDVLRRMCDVIAHRGPDDEAFHVEPGRVGLGFRRLSIIDLDGGRQPIADEDGRNLVTCNGEIYNFRQLGEGLRARGHRFRTGSDVEPVVHLYEESGVECLQKLQGMFAIALWDSGRNGSCSHAIGWGQASVLGRGAWRIGLCQRAGSDTR